MEEIVTEHAGNILRVQFNRPTKRNAMTSAMYLALASIFNEAANDENTRVVIWHGAGDSFCAGNDIEDFLKHPPGPGESPQFQLMEALVNFDKPLVAAVHGAAIGVAAAAPVGLRRVGRAHGAVDRGGVGLRRAADDLTGGRVRDRQGLPREGLDGAVDEDAPFQIVVSAFGPRKLGPADDVPRGSHGSKPPRTSAPASR